MEWLFLEKSYDIILLDLRSFKIFFMGKYIETIPFQILSAGLAYKFTKQNLENK